MKRTRLTRLSLFALLAAVVMTAAGVSAADEIFMWQVKSETATVSLVGSIHVGKPDFFPLAEPFETAFAAAGALAVEVDMSNPDNLQKSAVLVMQKGMLPGDITLQDRLAPGVWLQLEKYAEKNGFPLAMYSKFSPGLVAMMIVLEEYQKLGYDPELGIDQHFLDAAGEQEKEIRELETIESQLDLFFSISDDLDDLLVAEIIDQMDEMAALTEQMVVLWKTGDVKGLDKFLQDQVGDDPEVVDFYRTLLDDRNVKMAEKIDEWLQADTDIYVVVGAGHFAGDMGILRLLENKGYKVTQMRR